jgi:hypothetical protein
LALNSYFDENGFSSHQSLKNVGSTLIFILGYIFAWFLAILLKIFSRFSIRCQNFSLKIQKFLMWKGTLTLLMF